MNTMNSQTINQEAKYKANELILYMDNDQQVYNSYFMPWVNNYAKKVRKGIFNIEDGIKGMSYLMKNIQTSYNKELGTDKDGIIPEIFIKISKDEKRTIQIAFLRAVLNNVWEENKDLRDQTFQLIKSLMGFF